MISVEAVALVLLLEVVRVGWNARWCLQAVKAGLEQSVRMQLNTARLDARFADERVERARKRISQIWTQILC